LVLTIARNFSRQEVGSELEAKLDVTLQATLGKQDLDRLTIFTRLRWPRLVSETTLPQPATQKITM
jgi:hypothetical protein